MHRHTPFRLTAAVFVFAGSTAVAAPPPAKKADLLAGVKVPAGFEITLFAAPPDVSYPTCLACTPEGDVFVGIDENGSLGHKPGRARIVRCIDTDGDGKADKFVEFCKVNSPRGMIWDNGSLYVLNPPFLTVFRDKSGKGVADESGVLLSGLGGGIEHPRGADHTTNGIRLGIDGWIYIAAGDFGFPMAKGKDGKTLQFLGGGVARVRPDGTELEIVSRGQRNIYDLAISPELDIFTRDNTNDGDGWDVRFSHVVMGANFGYPTLFKGFAADIIQPLADYGGGAPTGSTYISEPTWPAGHGDSSYTCDWGRSVVYTHPVKRLGASYAGNAEQKPFLTIPRPTGIDIDGSGRMYVASWKDGGFAYDKPDVGFVVRVTPVGLKPAPFPNLKAASDDELLKHLASDSHVRRIHTQREILRRGMKPELAEKLTAVALKAESPGVRAAAIFTLKQVAGVASQSHLATLAGKAELREFALRALADRKSEAAGAPAKVFVDALADANPRIRLQAITGLARSGTREAAAAVVPLTADSDPVLSHIAVRGLVELGAADACLAAIDSGDAKLLPGVLRALQAMHEPKVVEGLIARVGQAKTPEVRSALLRTLCRLARKEGDWDGKTWWGTRPDTRGPYYRPVAWDQSEKIEALLRQTLSNADAETAASLVPELFRHRIEFPEATARLLKLAAESPAFRPTAVELIAKLTEPPAEAVAVLEGVAIDAKAESPLRAKALKALHALSGKPAGLEAAVRALAAARSSGPAEAANGAWDEFVRDNKQAKNAAAFIKLTEAKGAVERELAWTVLVHLAIAKNTPATARTEAARAVDRGWNKADSVLPLLKAVAHARSLEYGLQVRTLAKDGTGEVKEAATVALKRLGLDKPPADPKSLIAAKKYEDVLAAAVKEKGDPKAGADLFVRLSCVNCHTVSKSEAPKGPFLGDVAKRYNRAELVESILKPSAKIAQGFETQLFRRMDGTVETGFVVRESGEEVEIRTVNGVAIVIPKSDIDGRKKSELSVMPNGLADGITVKELASLLAYLDALSGK